MPIYRLDKRLRFPDPSEAEDGLLAVGGDLRPERLLLAYSSGIFPWYDDDQPILWHSPDPRGVLEVESLHVGRTLKKLLAKRPYAVRFDSAFGEVIRGCKDIHRPRQRGTWITDDMERAYTALHTLGVAHSVECWSPEGELVGGLYGVSLGRMFFGESMFSRAPDASKVATVGLVERLRAWGFRYVDCQVLNPHTEALGAVEWPRDRYLAALEHELRAGETRKGSWREPEDRFPTAP